MCARISQKQFCIQLFTVFIAFIYFNTDTYCDKENCHFFLCLRLDFTDLEEDDSTHTLFSNISDQSLS